MRGAASLAGAAALLVVGSALAQESKLEDRKVSATVVQGTSVPRAPAPPAERTVPGGDVTLNFPGVDVQQVARAVLGDILRVPYSIDPTLHGIVTVVTDRPIARSAVVPFLEGALRAGNLALVESNGTYVVLTVEQARNQAAVVGGGNAGFGTETYQLKFVSADQLKRLIDPVLPGVVVSADASRNVLTIAGTSGQRRSARDLVSQFDVNWLRAMSFALFIPQRTDARLIAPELDKLINSPNSPTNSLVKLIAMERLNGLLAISPQPQYLEDVRRWVEILDREGESNQARLFVYRVQNGRSADLARTLLAAFGGGTGAGGGRGQTMGAPPRYGAGGLPLGSTAATAASDLGGAPTDNSNVPSGSPLQPAPTPQSSTVSIGGGSSSLSPNPGGGNAGPVSGTTPSGMAITSDEANNAVVVFATPRDYAVIEDALRKLDVPPLQVMIEAAIAEVTLTKDLSYGVQWLFHQPDGSIGYTENTLNAIPTQVFPGFTGIIAKQSITATLNALSGITTVNVLSAPDLMVINNQTASLQVGDQVPITTASATSTINADAPIVNSVEYRDTGVILKITPRVNASGIVLLDVAQEVSAVNTTTSSGIDSPTISTRKIATSIAAQDGETIALGGLITNRNEKGKAGIPLLSTLPIIGALFGTHTDKLSRTELVVLLKPRVVRTVDDGRAVTDELKQKLQMLRDVTKKPSDLP